MRSFTIIAAVFFRIVYRWLAKGGVGGGGMTFFAHSDQQRTSKHED
jgi:hypothetical protein